MSKAPKGSSLPSALGPSALGPSALGPSAPGAYQPLFYLSAGGLGGVLWLGLELIFVVAFGGTRITGTWELGQGFLALAPAWLLVALPLGAWGGLGFYRARVSKRFRVELALASFVFGLTLGYGVGGGRHLSTPLLRSAFGAGLGLVAVLVAYWVAPRLQAALLRATAPEEGSAASGPGVSRAGVSRVGVSRAGAAWSWLAALLLLFAANQLLLVRLYPAFHFALSGLCLVLSGAGLVARFGARWPTAVLAFGLGLVAILGLRSQSEVASRLDNFRVVVAEGSPTLKLGVLLAARVAPPPPLDASALASPLGSRALRSTEFDLTGHSFLLVTIDALRADHVGAYGYGRPTTPAIDELAKTGFVFEATYAATPHTSYSLTSLFTGKYMRPLLLQGAGEDSDLLPRILQTYGYKTAAFYPPAVFFVNRERFQAFDQARLGFEYGWVEFAEGPRRVQQVQDYLDAAEPERPLFVWVHLFGPHEPYESGSVDFGPNDLDRYDSEIRSADDTVASLVSAFRGARPSGVVIVSADHGEEFGEHGGRYHGTTVYEEQVRVPLIWNGPGLPKGRHALPVQTVDIMPTVLSSLRIPVPPRVRGRDLTRLFSSEISDKMAPQGFAAAETETWTMLAEGQSRLLCARDTGACQLFSLDRDPGQKQDISQERPEEFARLRKRSLEQAASHGAFETRGLRSEGRDLPLAIVRGTSGDREVVPELCRLLDDADSLIRKKSAELVFHLGSADALPALRLSFQREEDSEVRAELALGLTRFGDSPGLTFELLDSADADLKRRAALSLAENGDGRGLAILLDWFHRSSDEAEMRTLLNAFSRLRTKDAVPFLVQRLDDVRLRPEIALALAQIGDSSARPALLARLLEERYVSTRPALFEALKRLGAKHELSSPLVTYLGMPEPWLGGLSLAKELGLLAEIGGPTGKTLGDISRLGDVGVKVAVTVPSVPRGQPRRPVRLLLLGRARGDVPVTVRIEPTGPTASGPKVHYRAPPELGMKEGLDVRLEPGPLRQVVAGPMPSGQAGARLDLAFFVPRDAEILGFAVVPERAEFPPPPPEPVGQSRESVERSHPD